MTKIKSYFAKEIFMLRVCGLSFKEHESIFDKMRTTMLLFVWCLYCFLAAGDLFKHDLDTVTGLLSYQIPISLGGIKGITVYVHRKKIGQLLLKLDNELKQFSNAHNGENLMKECALITSIQTIMYCVGAFFCYAAAVGLSAVKRIRSDDYHDWTFPYGIFSVVNVTYSPNYEICWAYQTASAFFLGLYFLTTDLLSAATICHVCYHLKILQNSFRRIVENSRKIMENYNETRIVHSDNIDRVSIDWKHLKTSLKDAVQYHLAIIDITKEIDGAFSILLLFVFLGTLGILAFMVFQASHIPLHDAQMLRRLGEVGIIFSQVFMVCFWSHQMILEGSQIGYAAYEANFVGIDLRLQKSLILVMRRSQYPIRLTAGYVEVSLSTFAWILRSSYSAYMVLRRQNLNEN